MKYRFITIMHNMKLENTKNKGTLIFEGIRLSNGKEVLDETLNQQPMKCTLGVHSSHEFEDQTYVYIDGTLYAQQGQVPMTIR